jgi:hypothetical protein
MLSPDISDEEITPEMIRAAEEALWDEATRLNLHALDEMPKSVIGVMLRAALLRKRDPQSI